MTLLAPALRRVPALPVDRAEALTVGALAVAAVLSAGPRPLLVGLLWLAVVTPRLVAVDVAQHRLPDAIVLPGTAVALAAVLLDAVVRGAVPGPALLAAAGYASVLLLLHAGGGMGLGDVKLAVPLGLLAGAAGAGLASPVLALVVGGAQSAVVLATRGRGGRIPFGPAMLLGCWVAILLRLS